MAEKLLAGREVIIEFVPVGNLVRVSAMDTKTLTEVVTQGLDAVGALDLRPEPVDELLWALGQSVQGERGEP